MNRNRELIVAPTTSDGEFLRSVVDMGIKTVFAESDVAPDLPVSVMTARGDSYVVAAKGEEQNGKRYRILSNADIESMLSDAAAGLDFVIVDVDDWKIIPLENAIAKLHDLQTRIMVFAATAQEARKMFSILDVGVDAVILETSSPGEVSSTLAYLESSTFRMVPARITAIRETGDGERVCVDTTSMLKMGEGLLVGNKSNFLFLVHNESVGSSFTSPRPFRVNAGAVHCYTLSPEGNTMYLSELEGGLEVLTVGHQGRSRRVTVGRSKIESRPMLFVGAATENERGGIIAQNAETIRFVRPGGDLVSVTHLKEGDQVLVYATPAAGRHFGMKVDDEYILEK